MSQSDTTQTSTSPDINILNVHTIHPKDLAMWVDCNLLGTRLPQFGANHTMDPRTEIVPYLAMYSNRLAFATELYNVVVGYLVDAKTNAKVVSKSLPKGNDYEVYKEKLMASQDILYRSIQSITNQYEATSRMLSGLDAMARLNRG